MTKSPTAPKTLSTEARQLWRRITGEYEFTDAASFVLLTELCAALDSLRAVQRRITADGLVIEGSTGQPVAHPLLGAEDRYRRTILAHVRALRITLSPGDY